MIDRDDLNTLTSDEYGVALRAVREYRRRRIAEFVGGDRFEVYTAQQNSELTEGRGVCTPRGHFLFRYDAEEANGMLIGVHGTENTCPVGAVQIFTSVDAWLGYESHDIHPQHRERARGALNASRP